MLNVPVMKFIIYINGTITALSNTHEMICCVNNVWPTDTMCKTSKTYAAMIVTLIIPPLVTKILSDYKKRKKEAVIITDQLSNFVVAPDSNPQMNKEFVLSSPIKPAP